MPSNDARFVELADRFLDAIACGEEVSWGEYAAQHPEHGQQIRDVFPLLKLVNNLARGSNGDDRAANPDGVETLPCSRFGEYTIVREIARGGMGVVYEAEHAELGHRVALKVQPALATSNSTAQERFRREARAGAQLQHENIVPVYEVGKVDGYSWLAMKLISGWTMQQLCDWFRGAAGEDASTQSAADVISTLGPRTASPTVSPRVKGIHGAKGYADNGNGRLRPEIDKQQYGTHEYYRAVARIGIQVADALEFAHQHGVVHRDVKPSNVIVDHAWHAWVTDFGLAKFEESKLTATGDVVGTLAYMAPEQFRGWADPRSDVYSLGATLYELLALRPPHEASDRISLIQRITTEEPRPLRRVDRHIPKDLACVVETALRHEPAERYHTAAAIREDLQRFLDGQPVAARGNIIAYQLRRFVRRHRRVAFAAALMMTVLVVGIIVTSMGWRKAADVNESLREQLYVSDIASAYDAYRRQRPDLVREILDQQIPVAGQTDQRGVAWHILDAISKPPIATTFRGHKGPVNEVAAVPGRSWIVSAGEDGTLQVWDYVIGKPVKTLTTPNGYPLYSVAVSPDGNYVAAGDWAPYEIPCGAWLWDLESGDRIRELQRVPSMVESIAFSPDGHRVAFGERNGDVWLVDVASSDLIKKQSVGSRNLTVRFSSDGSLFCFARIDKTEGRPSFHGVQMWDPRLESNRPMLAGGMNMLALFKGNRWLVTAGQRDHRVFLYDRTAMVADSFFDHGGDNVQCIALSPDDSQLALGHGDGMVRLWSVTSLGRGVETVVESETLKALRPKVFRAHDGQTLSVAFTEDGRFVTCGEDELVKVWSDIEVHPKLTGPSRFWPAQMSVGPGGALNAVCPWGKGSSLWVTHGGRDEWRRLEFEHGLMNLAFSPDGRFLTIKPDTKELSLRETHSFTHQRVVSGAFERIEQLTFSPDGRFIVAACEDSATRVWDTSNGTIVHTWHHTEHPRHVDISVNNHVAVSGDFRHVKVYDLVTFELIETLDNRAEVVSLDWSSDGKLLACGQTNRDTVVWQVGEDSTPIRVGSHDGSVPQWICFLDDNTRLATAGGRTIYLWHLPTQRELGLLYEVKSGERISHLEVTPDGSHLVAGLHGTPYERNIAMWPLK